MVKKSFEAKSYRIGYTGNNEDRVVFKNDAFAAQKTDKADVLMSEAEAGRSPTMPFVKALATEAFGIHPDLVRDKIIKGPLKTMQRAFLKANTRYEGDLKEVKDFLRYTILFDHPDQILKFRNTFRKGFEKRKFFKDWANKNKNSVHVAEIEDWFLFPHEDRARVGLNMICAIYLGKNKDLYLFEIQGMHQKMQKTNYLTRSAYEKAEEMKKEIIDIEKTAINEKRNLRENERDYIVFLKSQIHNENVSIKGLYETDCYELNLLQLMQNPPPKDWRPNQDLLL